MRAEHARNVLSLDDQQPIRAWSALSQAERDAAYNNRGSIADADALIGARRTASQAVREKFPCHLDVPYGEHPRESWDIFPGRAPDAPCLVFIHGGYWQGGDRSEFSACVQGVLEKGWSAALCSYPLAPDATLTQIVASVSRAVTWFAENRFSYGAGGGLVLSGWSAGAHLAALFADHPSVDAVLCISGVFELTPIRSTFLNAKLNLIDEEIEGLSPLRLAPVDKPFIVAFGADELPELQRQSREFFNMRQGSGVPGQMMTVRGANHLTVLEGFFRADGALTRAAEAALSLAASDYNPE